MHHFIFSTKDNWISSGSNHINGESFKDQNFGQDPILEVKKEFFNLSFDYPTRALIDFSGTEFNELSKSVADGSITKPRFYLRLFEAEGNSDLTLTYKLAAIPLSQSWDEGVGKFGDNPKTTNGCSWKNRNFFPGASETNWTTPGGTVYATSASEQSFSNQSPDVEMDVTNAVSGWISGSLINYGFLLRFSGSQETDDQTFGQLKFFSTQTHTIFQPKLEVRWDDHLPCTGSNTGSMTELTMSGQADNFLYMKRLRQSYKETERVKFRVQARKRYIQKTFSTSVQTASSSYIPEGSGSYSIVDVATGESIVPFSEYTKLSCDAESNYFIQWLNGFAPDRVYKILYKVKYNDGQEQIYDNDFEFIVRR
mgnify:FL=1